MAKGSRRIRNWRRCPTDPAEVLEDGFSEQWSARRMLEKFAGRQLIERTNVRKLLAVTPRIYINISKNRKEFLRFAS
jgi:hypothetical protein